MPREAPRANAGTPNTIKDAYFFTRRFETLIAVVTSVPEDARTRGGRLFLAFSCALLGQKDEAEPVPWCSHTTLTFQPNSCSIRYLGGLAIQIGERFILDVDLWRFYGRVPLGRGGWEWYIDFTVRISLCWDRIDSRPDS